MSTRTLTISADCCEDCREHDRVGDCLRRQLTLTAGVRDVRFRHDDGAAQATIELEYDPRLVTLGELHAELERAGGCFSKRRAVVVLGIDGMASPRSEQAIEAALAKMPGVVASASFASRSLRIEFDRERCALP